MKIVNLIFAFWGDDVNGWLNGKEARKYLSVSESAFYRLVRNGLITQYFIEGIRDPRYSKEELDKLPKPRTEE